MWPGRSVIISVKGIYGVRLISSVSFHESESSIEFSDDLSKRSLRY